MSLAEQEALRYDWSFWSRPEQRAPERNPNSPDGTWSTWLLLSGRGFGKEIADYTDIPTPSGWTTMGDLEVGDTVFDEAGRPCRVLAKFKPDVTQQYRLTFSDGSFIDAGRDHQWVTWDSEARKAFNRSPYEDTSKFPENWPKWRLRREWQKKSVAKAIVEEALELSRSGFSARAIAKILGCSRQALVKHFQADRFVDPQPRDRAGRETGPKIRTTGDIVATIGAGNRGDTNHCIPCCAPLKLPEIDLPIPAYTLGVWLGDGSCADGTITCHQDDMAETRRRIEDDGIITTRRSNQQSMGTLGLTKILKANHLIGNKHVPRAYLRASEPHRIALLRGLMDTDGNIEGGNTVAFVNTNRLLIDAVEELVISLGMKTKIRTGIGKCNGKVGKRYWRVQFTPTINPFSLHRKANRIKIGGAQSLRNHHRMIVSAELIEPVSMSCITVDSPNSMYLAGRAMIPTHNTRSAAEFVREEVESGRRRSVGLVGQTIDDARKVMVEGVSGLLTISPESFKPIFEPSNRRLVWPNGAMGHLFSAEESSKLRGPNFDLLWYDEICAFGGPDQAQEIYDMGTMCLRIPGPMGHAPCEVITTTPKPMPLLRQIMKSPDTVITGGSTFDNVANLDQKTLERWKKKYEGTRLGRQELYGIVLDSFEGALWNPGMLDNNRCKLGPGEWKLVRGDNSGAVHLVGPLGEMVYFKRIIVSVDPAGTANRKSNETGIVVCGLGDDEDGYLLADHSGIYSPEQWGMKAVDLFHDWGADKIIAEQNYGGDMVKANILASDRNVPVKLVVATRGKRIRAEPISTLYEQNRVHHVGQFEDLEDQLVTWDPFGSGDSPDRLDALVWGFIELMLKRSSRFDTARMGYLGPIPLYGR